MTTIRNENDAWSLVKDYLDGKAIDRPVFEDWPRMEIVIRGDEYLGSITASQMDAFMEFQKTVNRSYAAIARGHFDGRYLTGDEEDELNLRTEVREGSSILDTDLSPLVQALSSVISHATPSEVIIGGILICLSITSPILVKSFFEGRARQLELNNTKDLIKTIAMQGQQDKENLSLYASALKAVTKKFPAIASLPPQLRKSQLRLLNSLNDADTAEINGVPINNQQILELNQRKPRVAQSSSILKGQFLVASMQKYVSHYRLKLTSDHQAVLARLNQDTVSEAKLGKLIKAFQKSTAVDFVIQITRSDQSVLKGTIANFSFPK